MISLGRYNVRLLRWSLVPIVHMWSILLGLPAFTVQDDVQARSYRITSAPAGSTKGSFGWDIVIQTNNVTERKGQYTDVGLDG